MLPLGCRRDDCYSKEYNYAHSATIPHEESMMEVELYNPEKHGAPSHGRTSDLSPVFSMLLTQGPVVVSVPSKEEYRRAQLRLHAYAHYRDIKIIIRGIDERSMFVGLRGRDEDYVLTSSRKRKRTAAA